MSKKSFLHAEPASRTSQKFWKLRISIAQETLLGLSTRQVPPLCGGCAPKRACGHSPAHTLPYPIVENTALYRQSQTAAQAAVFSVSNVTSLCAALPFSARKSPSALSTATALPAVTPVPDSAPAPAGAAEPPARTGHTSAGSGGCAPRG